MQVRVVACVEDRVKEAIRKNAEFFVNTAGRARRAVPRDRARHAATSRRSTPTRIVARRRSAAHRPDRRAALRVPRLDHRAAARRQGRHPRLPQVGRVGGAHARRDPQGEPGRDRAPARQRRRAHRGGGAAARRRSSAGVGDASQLRATLGQHRGALGVDQARHRSAASPRPRRRSTASTDVTSDRRPRRAATSWSRRSTSSIVVGDKARAASTADAQAWSPTSRKGKGTAGALLVDQQIYDDLKELVRDLKRNPWKFFWKE